MIRTKLRVFTAFSGYDSQCMALDRLGIDYDLVGWSEINKYAIQAHNAVYPQYAGRNYGDISKVDWGGQVPDFDLFTYSFPCQSISAAGRQEGLTKGSGTRSSLLWECEKAISIKRPKYLLMENVKALVQKKFMPMFDEWLHLLENYGYTNYWAVLNAKDFGVPQNRERVFCVSIHGDHEPFEFPKPMQLEKVLGDALEDDVDETYFLSSERIDGLLTSTLKEMRTRNGFSFHVKKKATSPLPSPTSVEEAEKPTILYMKATEFHNNEVMQIGNLIPDRPGRFSNSHRGRVYSTCGIAPTLNTCGGGNLEPKILLAVEDTKRMTRFGVTIHPTCRKMEFDNQLNGSDCGFRSEIASCITAHESKGGTVLWLYDDEETSDDIHVTSRLLSGRSAENDSPMCETEGV